ncbi:UNVERIFIED_CONTAM: putative mitochondrial protein [Sesamum angustifolium]|uniref:Mitochondrial protein n=1 Tax=Sesamum angustifolium TaxID=2727405 RepID=A0AAW2IRE7_9LAMI
MVEFSGVYGKPDTSKRTEFWNLLSRLHDQSARPWLCAGDFNERLEQSEKKGGPLRAEWQIRNFRNCLTYCELHDMGFLGSPYTWCNNQREPLTVYERLDRKQRSKVLWLKEGDRNSKFFHAKANHRYQVNSIRRIKKSNGEWTETAEGVQQCILDYFEKVFTSSRPLAEDVHTGTEHLQTVVDIEIAEDLQRPYMETEPQSLTQYRPISLCNVAYKIASKTIANRLKPWLDRIICPSQSTFVLGSLITDNMLLAFETKHFLHTHSKGLKHFMNLKLDISKAYDHVEWSFLWTVLGKLGFPCNFVELVMLYVSSVSYSFILSGKQFGSISPQRGLRQGPSFPLSVSTVYRVPERAVSSSGGEGYNPRLASGQQINLAKSSVAFSRNTPWQPNINWLAHWDRIWRRIQGWHEKTLSQAGKAVLIQAVVQAIPSYAMSCFRLLGLFSRNSKRCQLIFFGMTGIDEKFIAKQLWRLLSRPESLVSKVLKAKYFQRTHLFEAQIGTRPSYTWRSLFAALNLLKAGCRWWIGTGHSVNIWTDPWVPRTPPLRVITPKSSDVHISYVSELMVVGTGEWDVELINALF